MLIPIIIFPCSPLLAAENVQDIVRQESASVIAQREEAKRAAEKQAAYEKNMQDTLQKAKEQALQLRQKLLAGASLEDEDLKAAAPTEEPHAQEGLPTIGEEEGEAGEPGANSLDAVWMSLQDGAQPQYPGYGYPGYPPPPMYPGYPPAYPAGYPPPGYLTHGEQPR